MFREQFTLSILDIYFMRGKMSATLHGYNRVSVDYNRVHVENSDGVVYFIFSYIFICIRVDESHSTNHFRMSFYMEWIDDKQTLEGTKILHFLYISFISGLHSSPEKKKLLLQDFSQSCTKAASPWALPKVLGTTI